MLRRKDLPDYFMYRGNRLAFHRLADGPSLGRLDPYAAGEQAWPMLNGHEIAVTAEEIRDITFQVYGITLPPVDPRDVSQFEARIAALEAKLAAAPEQPEAPPAQAETEPEPAAPSESDTRDEELEAARLAAANAEAEAERLRAELEALRTPDPVFPDMGEKLSEYGSTWEDEVTGDTLLEAFEEDETAVVDVVRRLSATRQKHLSEQLNVEKARLRRERMLTDEPIPREASIDRLLGLLTRRGEV